MKTAGELSRRTETVATYALCGFSNLSSMTHTPSRRAEFVRAIITGCCACFLMACVAANDDQVTGITNSSGTKSCWYYKITSRVAKYLFDIRPVSNFARFWCNKNIEYSHVFY